jgi:hypothetical protein
VLARAALMDERHIILLLLVVLAVLYLLTLRPPAK